jgi:hypothetical protein
MTMGEQMKNKPKGIILRCRELTILFCDLRFRSATLNNPTRKVPWIFVRI